MGRKMNRQGFTLLEMLLIVAVLAVLAAVVVPSVGAIRDGLLYRRNTDRAKLVFLTAQRQLIRLRSEGGTDALENCRSGVPQQGEEEADGLVWLTGEDPEFFFLMPEDTLEEEILSEPIIIEFCPETAAVQAVFYGGDGDLSRQYAAGTLRRDPEYCRERLLGYYGGEGLTAEELGIYRVAAEVSYIDGQVGLVSIRVPTQNDRMENLFENGEYQRFAQGLDIALTVIGERGGLLQIPVKEAGQMASFSIQPGAGGMTMLCFTVCLDSLSGGSFAGNGRILAGDNVSLRAEVNFLPGPEDPLILVDTAVATGINPMFAAFSQISPRKWALKVSNGRHLQNLNAIAPEIAGAVDVVLLSAGPAGKSEDQVIDWQETVDYYGGSLAFTPIHSPWLFGSGTWDGESFTEISHRQKNAEILGCNTVIRNLSIDSGGEFVGLFACLDTDVDGIYLADPVIRGENALAVGALVGAAGENSCITDCGVLAEDPEKGCISGKGWVGGLVGLIEGEPDAVVLKNCFNQVNVSGADGAGGLVGSNRGGCIRNCYVLAALENAAGFTAANSGAIRKCFANVTMEAGNGFVRENTGLVEVCYGWVTGAGELETSGDCRGCYFGRMTGELDAVLYDAGGNRTAITHIDGLTDARSLLGTGWYTPGRFPAYPADEELTDYPYPMNGVHYGDWPIPGRGQPCGVLYYERYADGTLGVTMENLSRHPSGESAPLKTGVAVLDGGYALWYRRGTMPFDAATEAMLGPELTELHTAAGLSEEFTLRTLTAEGLVTVAIRDGYDSATLITWYADTIHRIGPPYRIHTQSQLEQLGRMPGEYLLEGTVVLDESYAGPEVFSGTFTGAENSLIRVSGIAESLVGTLTGQLRNLRIEGATGDLPSGLLADVVDGGTVSGCEIAAEVHTAAGAVAGTVLGGAIRNTAVSGRVVPLGEGCGSFAGEISGGQFRDCHVLAENGLPFAGKLVPSRWEVPENATHYSDVYLPEGRYSDFNAAREFAALTGPRPVYDALFENCTVMAGGEAQNVVHQRYYYALTATPGYQAWAEGPDTGRYALVTESGLLLGVNEMGQIAALRDFGQLSIPEGDIWAAAEDEIRNLEFPEVTVQLGEIPEGAAPWVEVRYTETVLVTLSQSGTDGGTVTSTEEQQLPRSLRCRLYRVGQVTDWTAVWVDKGYVPGEVKGQ